HVRVEQPRAAERPTSHVPESPLRWEHESSRIEPLIRLAQNHRPLKIRIPVGNVGITGVSGPRGIGTNYRREGEPAFPPDAPIPLPAANQLAQNRAGATKRQLIAKVHIELVVEAVGRDTAVQPAKIGTIEVRWLVSGRRRQDGGVVIHYFPVSV